jgi:hypothetical protein
MQSSAPTRHAGKVFCVGRNKTGTTSIERALTGLGYRFSPQHLGEALLGDWVRRDFRRIIALAGQADAGQDIPYSLPYTYQALDIAYPGSKFILTVRDTPEDWLTSLVRFHAGLMHTGDKAPAAADLQRYSYHYPGYLYDAQRTIYGVGDDELYDPELYIRHYLMHAHNVSEYFRYRPDQLLVLNVAEADAMQRLCEFLGMAYSGQAMPHLNRSRHAVAPETFDLAQLGQRASPTAEARPGHGR